MGMIAAFPCTIHTATALLKFIIETAFRYFKKMCVVIFLETNYDGTGIFHRAVFRGTDASMTGQIVIRTGG